MINFDIVSGLVGNNINLEGVGATQGKWPTGRAAPKGMFLRLV